MATFGRVAPTVPVKDIEHALQFYRDVLGFEVIFTNGEPVTFAVINQGDTQLHLRVIPEQAGSLHAHLMVDDLDAIHNAFQQAGISVRQLPTIQPWGLRDLIVTDPDGNCFEIAEPVREWAAS